MANGYVPIQKKVVVEKIVLPITYGHEPWCDLIKLFLHIILALISSLLNINCVYGMGVRLAY